MNFGSITVGIYELRVSTFVCKQNLLFICDVKKNSHYYTP